MFGSRKIGGKMQNEKNREEKNKLIMRGELKKELSCNIYRFRQGKSQVKAPWDRVVSKRHLSPSILIG